MFKTLGAGVVLETMTPGALRIGLGLLAPCYNISIRVPCFLQNRIKIPSIPGVPHIFGIVWIFIPVCWIKQPNGFLSRICVQPYNDGQAGAGGS